MADIFVSYTASDREWAFWIAKELEALGHRPRVHEWEIKSGDDIYAWMEQRHDVADHVLCVVSDDYLKAPYSTLERNAALWQAAAQRPGFVLFVAVKPCKLPTLVDHYRRCELFGVSGEAARLRFREFIEKRGAPSAIAFPGQEFAVSNIPIHVPMHFMGRDDAVTAIETALKRNERRVAITALHGLRGVGKTTLAAAYAERHRGNYRATWWIRAQTESGMRADLVGLGVRLKWVAPDAKEEPALATVLERLRHEGLGIILIFDNAPDAAAITPYLPFGGLAQVLITSNARAWRGVAAPVEIRVWPKEVGADFLIVRTGREGERQPAEALSAALGGLPLAHEQAAAYCERLEIPLAEYHKRFEAAPVQLLEDEHDAPLEYHNRLTVAKTFALAIERAVRIHPAAELLIVHAALLAPEPIPLFLFAEASERFGDPLATALANNGLEDLLAVLRSFALVERETVADERAPLITTEMVRLHPLVREVAMARCESEAREEARRVLVAAVATVYPDEVWGDSKAWPRARRLDALVLALTNGDAAPQQGSEEPVAGLLDALAQYRYGALGAHSQSQARPLFERALAIREKALGPEHPATATSLNNLSHLLQAQGDLAGARSLHERALAIREKALGPAHPDTASSLDNLASLLMAQGELVTARPLYERALAIFEMALGPEDPTTAMCLNDLAVLLRAQGDFVAARGLEERALVIFEKALGPEHHHTATSLDGLAGGLQAQGDLAGARPLYERALAIREKVLGSEHPETAKSLNNLANLLRATGDTAQAEQLFRRAIAVGEKLQGDNHPDIATRVSNLAVLLHSTGRANEAEPLFLRALAIGEHTLGHEHPLTQRFRCHFARLLLDTGRAAEASICAEAALAVHAATNGPNHPWTKDSARVTATALDALGRAEEAKALREKYGIEPTAPKAS